MQCQRMARTIVAWSNITGSRGDSQTDILNAVLQRAGIPTLLVTTISYDDVFHLYRLL